MDLFLPDLQKIRALAYLYYFEKYFEKYLDISQSERKVIFGPVPSSRQMNVHTLTPIRNRRGGVNHPGSLNFTRLRVQSMPSTSKNTQYQPASHLTNGLVPHAAPKSQAVACSQPSGSGQGSPSPSATSVR